MPRSKRHLNNNLHCSGLDVLSKGSGGSKNDNGDPSSSSSNLPPLAELNKLVEQLANPEGPLLERVQNQHKLDGFASTMWTEWLWGGDPCTFCNAEMLMNETHMLGLLLARYQSCKMPMNHLDQEPCQASSISQIIMQGGCESSRAQVLDVCRKPIARYTLRDLRDSVQNLQLHWVPNQAVDIGNIHVAVDQLFARRVTCSVRALMQIGRAHV